MLPLGPAFERQLYPNVVNIDTASEHEEDLRNKSTQEENTNSLTCQIFPPREQEGNSYCIIRYCFPEVWSVHFLDSHPVPICGSEHTHE